MTSISGVRIRNGRASERQLHRLVRGGEPDSEVPLQGLVEAHAHPGRLPDQVTERQRVAGGQGQPRPAPAAAGEVPGGVERGQREQLRRQLVGHHAGDERGDAGPEARHRAQGIGGQGRGDELSSEESHRPILAQSACETLDMLKSGIRSAGVAVREK